MAAKTLALSVVDILENPKHVEAARASFEKRRAAHEYRSRVPAGHKPPLKLSGPLTRFSKRLMT